MGSSPSSRKYGDGWDEEAVPPPPYEAAKSRETHEDVKRSDEAETSPNPIHPPQIKASDTPQWRWNKKQCQQWITEVLVEYCCKDRRKAEKLANLFEGFGPILYMKSYQGWTNYLGVDGQAIYGLLVEVCKNDGAVPKGIVMGEGA
jgi:hypothetical protein